MDELNRFSTLVCLKFSKQPELLKSLGPRQQRQQLVARVAGLLQLNSSDVRRRERDDAEKIYLHVTLSDALSSSTDEVEIKKNDNDRRVAQGDLQDTFLEITSKINFTSSTSHRTSQTSWLTTLASFQVER